MKKTAALAVIAVLAATGCATVPAELLPAKTWTLSPADPQPASQSGQQRGIVEIVQDQWIGDDVPTAHWIETAAVMACKRMNGGLEVGTYADGEYGPLNSELLIVSASKLVCP